MKKSLIFLTLMLIVSLTLGCSKNKEVTQEVAKSTVNSQMEDNDKSQINISDSEIQSLKHKEEFLNSKEGHDFQVASWKFTKAYLSGDISTMKKLLIEPKNKDNDYNTKNMFNDVEFLILKLDDKDIKENMVRAEYEFGLKGNESLQYLNLEMKKINNEWKVQHYGLEM